MANFLHAKYNTLDEQVEENKHNIKELINIIKEAFSTNNISLTISDTTILISNTNAPIDTVDGWLFDDTGKLFKITGGDGTSLLLQFYSDFRGPQGEQGVQGLPGVQGYSLRYIDDNYIVGTYTYALSDIANINNIIIGDQIVFTNFYVGKIINIDVDNDIIAIDEVAQFIPNKKYQHNIIIKYNRSGNDVYLNFQIINDDLTPFDRDTLKDYLHDNDFLDTNQKYFVINGYDAFASRTIMGLCNYVSGGNDLIAYVLTSGLLNTMSISNYVSFDDNVIEI